ncbi:uncharacterized protein TRIADDRAFT_25687 [Trichoplax adhaerens]|uniref:ER lumen protein-retaining receptor n=1 Tax=Trichoplax adhaerens TaxID=10228 RepID=B3RWD1_TRIAD|nr:hypothetical protein TRIADDRAFT_25687 [Trichoplax adhaerens]EDV24670.1 hypothetical protein TRIADDRAFT_25687 [Trichoplax adhaerens]|eukprot:XP_002112560.1 hypothetical protein TRIADDRAFT_25687 [Trichoplax adhaerens]
MNIYRLLGDGSHLIAMIYLLLWIIKRKSCSGISGKTQFVHCIVFTLRYLDLFKYFISYYNTLIKLIFLTITYATTGLIAIGYNGTYEMEEDNLKLSYILIPSFILGMLFTYTYDILEICWSMSLFLEALAILPQLIMSHNRGESLGVIRHYMLMLAFYKTMYCFNWVYRKLCMDYFSLTSVIAGTGQTLVYYAAVKMLYSDQVVFYDRDIFLQYKTLLTESSHAQNRRLNQNSG